MIRDWIYGLQYLNLILCYQFYLILSYTSYKIFFILRNKSNFSYHFCRQIISCNEILIADKLLKCNINLVWQTCNELVTKLATSGGDISWKNKKIIVPLLSATISLVWFVLGYMCIFLYLLRYKDFSIKILVDVIP